jgi:hypothetical protein
MLVIKCYGYGLVGKGDRIFKESKLMEKDYYSDL